MRTRNPYLAPVMMLATLWCLTVNAHAQGVLQAPHHNVTSPSIVGCLDCHDLTATGWPKFIPEPPGYVARNPAVLENENTTFNLKCWECHSGSTVIAGGAPVTLENMATHSSLTMGSTKYGEWAVGCTVCHNAHSQGGQPGGNFIWNFARLDQIEVYGGKAAKSGKKTIIFNGPTGPKSFADGDGTYDGICEVCHTMTTYHRNNDSGDHTHNAGSNCISCHTHASGFKGGADHSSFIKGDTTANGNCVSCHAAIVADPALHPSCETCHTASPPAINTTSFVGGDTGNPYAALTDNGNYSWNGLNRIQDTANAVITDAGFIAILCSECHDTKPAGLADGSHGGHPVTDWDYSLINSVTNDCLDCHADSGLGTVGGVHSNNCALCHVDPANSNYARMIGAGGDGDATLAVGRAGDCLTCHPGATYTKTSIHHDTANAVATPTSACTSCHNTANGHAGNHDALVAMQNPNCQVCHAATAASGGDNVPVDGTPGNTVHDYCTSCHVNLSGDLIETVSIPTPNGWVTTMNNADGTTATSNGGGTCTACHTAYFDGHEHGTAGPPEHSMSTVALCLNCHTATTIPYLGAGEVHETLACYTCHSTTDGLLIGSAIGAGAGANCQTCHIGYFDNHGHSHTFTATADCATCHNLDNTDGSTARDAIAAPFTGASEVHAGSGCATCHDAGTGALRSLAIGNEAAAGCIDCHTATWTTIHTAALGTVQPAVDHTGLVGFYTACVNCHVIAADSNARVATDTPFIGAGEVHASAGCLTCHTGANNGGFIAGPFAKADLIKTDGAVCAQCHIATTTWKGLHTGATGLDHTTRVDGLAACTTCHNATAGGPNGLMPVDAIPGNKVHNDCYDCHNSTVGLNLGQLLAVTATGGSANITNGNCGTCHSATYFDNHTHHYTVNNQVVFSATVDRSQGADLAANACDQCHTDNTDGSGTPLNSFTDILGEHVTGCGRCHSYTDDGDGTPLEAEVAAAMATPTPTPVNCTTCHVKKLWSNAPSLHGGHAPNHFGWAGNCQSCHGAGLAAEEVVAGIHGNNCDLCHTTGGPYNAATEKLGANGDGDARLADGSAAAATPFDPAVYTCTTCHNQAQVPGFHGITIAQAASSHQLSSNSSGGYDCESCHSANIGNEQLSTHMPADTVANCTAVCHGNTTPSATSGIVAKTVVDTAVAAGTGENCEACHAAKGDYRRHGLTDNATVADGIGDGTGGVVFHNNLGNSTGQAVTYTGKLAGAYGGLKVSSYNCGDCHAADPNTKAISALEAMQLHTSTNGSGRGNCLTCHVNAANVADEIAAGIGGAVQYCESCHSMANGSGPSGEAMYQYDGVRHHKTAHAQAGDCTYCHADPRPAATTQAGAYAATADIIGTYDTGWIADYSTATPNPIPKQPACRLCHTNYGTDGTGTPWSVNVSGGNGNHGYNIAGYSGTATERTTGLTVYANDFNAGLSGAGDNETVTVNATRVTQNTVHRIDANDGSAMIKVYDYGACFGCHSVQVMHAAPVPGADYPALTNTTAAENIQKIPWDTLRYAPGRAVFNRLRGPNDNNQAWNNHRLRHENGIQDLYGQGTADPRGRRYIRDAIGNDNTTPTAAGWNFNSLIAHSAVTVPLHASFSNFDNQPGSVALYFTNIAAPVIPDYVRFISAVWNGTTVTVEAANDDGCAALSARTRPDGVQRITAGSFTGTTVCTGTFNLGSIIGVTLDIETTNGAGTNSTGNAISSLLVATAVDDTLGSAATGGPYALDVLANDTGTDLRVVAIGTVSKTSGAGTCGTITNDTWSIGYTPGGGDAVCSFTYQAQAFVSGSPYGAASQATVTVNQTLNAAPTLSITEPSGQTGQSLSSPVAITYSLADSDDVVTVSFSLDTDTNPGNGTGPAITCTGGTGQGNEGTNVTCTWDASAIATGGNTYYIYGVTNDGVNPAVGAYSGSITFASCGTLAQLANWSAVANATGTAVSGTYNVPAGSGTSRLLIVSVATETSATATTTWTVTYGGQALTPITSYTGNAGRINQWIGYLDEAGLDAASNTTLSATIGGGSITRSGIHAAVYDYVNQTNPLPSANSSGSGANTSRWANNDVTIGPLAWAANDQPLYTAANQGARTITVSTAGYTQSLEGTYTDFTMESGYRTNVATGGSESITVTWGGTGGSTVLGAVLQSECNSN